MINLVTALSLIDDQYIEMIKSIERLMDINIEMIKGEEFNLQLFGESKAIEDRINRLDLEIREDSIVALARFQPAASDLRKLIMMADSARLLERMGDLLKANLMLLKNIEEDSPHLKFAFTKDLLPMVVKIKALLTSYIKAYIDNDENILYAIVALDEEIDGMTNVNCKNYISYMEEEKENIKGGTELYLIDKKFERISDHIVHLAKDLIYILNGKNLRKIELLMKAKENQ
ncbi:MAG: phosphate signaling complex PhoU family protein [Fusobacteriaceae bacterium]